jgi:hypothetical protein
MRGLALLLVAIIVIGAGFVLQQITEMDARVLTKIVAGVLVGVWLLWALIGIIRTDVNKPK